MKHNRVAAALAVCLLTGALGALPCAAEPAQQGTALADAVAAADGLPLNQACLPNAALLEELRSYDDDGDGVLSTKEAGSVTSLYLDEAGAEPLDGIEYLTDLESLYCTGSELTRLDLSMLDELEWLSAYDGALEELLLPPGIKSVDLRDCELTALDLSGCPELERLDVMDNRLTALDLSGCGALEELYCAGNKLTALDVSGCPDLETLTAYGNALTELNMTGCTALERLDVGDNKLTRVQVSGLDRLESLSVEDNALTELDITGCTNLTDLYCSGNKLTELDLSGCPSLDWLSCYDNKITQLDASRCEDLTRDNLLADDDCKVRYGTLGGIDWGGTWGAVRLLLAAVAVVGAIVWLVRRKTAK